jgi:pimeloyl-ACP methyl ester carboxylesterase
MRLYWFKNAHTGAVMAIVLGAGACARNPGVAPATGTLRSVAAEHLAAARDQFFTVGRFRIRYREIGRGTPVLFLHGRSSSLNAWSWMGDSLAVDYHVIAIDERGAGESTKSGDASDYGPAMAQDVIGVLDHLHLTRAHLVGHSLGAVIAAYVATHHPNRVKSVSLLAGALFPDSASFAAITGPYVQALESGGDLRAYYRARGVPDSLAAVLSATMLATNDVPSLVATTRAAVRLILSRELVTASHVSALVVVGSRDDLFEYDRQFASRWPKARFLEVTGADHGQIVRRAETLEAVRAHLRQVEARDSGPASPH